jgi:CBS domain-containing protein
MRQTFSLGRISGIRIGVNWSVLAIVALLAYGLAAGQFPAEVPHRPEAEYVVAAVVTAVVYMGSLLAQFLTDYLPWSRHSAFPVVADGQTVGLVTVHRVNQVPSDERGQITVRDVACPLPEIARATPDESVADVLPRLNQCTEGRALVFDNGHLAGIVAPADISRALERLTRSPGAPGLRS